MRGHLHLAFDAELAHVQRVCCRVLLGLQPVGSPANEIRSEQDERLLKSDGRFGTHFEMVQGEHLLALFNASLNRLPTVVLLEPPRQLLCHRVRTEMNQGTLLLISRPVLETTLASLECIWRFCQCMYTSCPRLTFFSPCLLHTFTQHSL